MVDAFMKIEYILGLAVAGWALYEWMKPASDNGDDLTTNNSLDAIRAAYAAQVLRDAGAPPTAENVQAAAIVATANPNSTAYANAKQALANANNAIAL
jgi:hypothetical protein